MMPRDQIDVFRLKTIKPEWEINVEPQSLRHVQDESNQIKMEIEKKSIMRFDLGDDFGLGKDQIYLLLANNKWYPQTGWGPTNQIYYFWITTDAFRNGRQFLVECDQSEIRLEIN